KKYDASSWLYEGCAEGGKAVARHNAPHSGHCKYGAGTAADLIDCKRDLTLDHPRCVYQVLKRHFARYTPELVERFCGVSQERFLKIADTFCSASGPEKTGAICYALGWTQQSKGPQIIRAAALIQLLLGNMGRPGGGILALRGHASIQGSTDIPALYNLLPGYIPMPRSQDVDLETFLSGHHASGGGWGNFSAYTVSLLKAYWGEAATAENEFGFGYLPRIDRRHHAYHTALEMLKGGVAGYFLLGENPAVGNANSGLH